MSYILDALKKAESERKLGSVPNVYMESLPFAKSDRPTSSMRRPWVWIIVALLAAAGIAAAWMALEKKEELIVSPATVAQQPAEPEPVVKEQPHAAVAQQAAAQLNKAPVKHEDSGRKSKKSAAAARQAKPVTSAAGPARATKEGPAKSDARAEPEKSNKESDKARAELASLPASHTTSNETHIVTLRELPDRIQRSIPPISVGGYIYSANPADRSMLLNNRLIREGEQAASGLMLEKMLPKEAILSYQGQRFRLPY